MAASCIFCRIAAGELGTEFVHEDDVCVAFRDLNPQAPTHALLIPRLHTDNIAATSPSDEVMLGHLLAVAPRVAERLGLGESGFRLVINSGPDGGQSVDHLHVHILGGRRMAWPPG